MVFLKLDPASGTSQFAQYIGGSAEDAALVVLGNSDGYMYALG